MTQMSEFVTQIKLTFLVFGEVFNPEDFTEEINISPLRTWLKEDRIETNIELRRDGAIRRRKESAWEYTIGYTTTLDFRDLSKRFEEVFKDRVDLIRSFVQKNDVDTTINVVVEIANAQVPSLTLSKSFISLLNDLNLELDFDIYVLEDD